ncbi:exonuclease domain-containing protein [Heyndrickxia camelliae]|uniref:DNA polymerase III subunit epsilon n=1 Tax=Heyndrickxia camelliae TaxID=1707093 RepID=A0A2N3LMI0_9BACI|nr:exonuclease domain-containing protein [Heyndrickxia camelliae]PKR85797.1 DNA polymerase III subunit epsilon [Heyndrickxia camelliae]
MRIDSIFQYMKEVQGRINANVINALQGGQSLQQKAVIRRMEKDAANNHLTIPLSELKVTVVDIETTGFYPDKGDVMFSIGAINMKGANIFDHQTYYSLINTEIPIPKEIQTLTKIQENELAAAPSREEVLKGFFQFIQQQPLVAHHSNHEKKFFQHESWKLFRTPFRNRIIDTSFLSRVIYPESELKTLDEYCISHNIEIKNRHHAMGDAFLTAKLWSIFMEEVQKRGFETLYDIYEYLSST